LHWQSSLKELCGGQLLCDLDPFGAGKIARLAGTNLDVIIDALLGLPYGSEENIVIVWDAELGRTKENRYSLLRRRTATLSCCFRLDCIGGGGGGSSKANA